jgi:hypothetical protein
VGRAEAGQHDVQPAPLELIVFGDEEVQVGISTGLSGRMIFSLSSMTNRLFDENQLCPVAIGQQGAFLLLLRMRAGTYRSLAGSGLLLPCSSMGQT